MSNQFYMLAKAAKLALEQDIVALQMAQILHLAFLHKIDVPNVSLILQFHARYVDIHQVANPIGYGMCKALPEMHAFMGCL